ncbi:MAG TPA: ATP-binding cassette domain-containing protein, partial [Abditibacterium sp.]
MLSIDNVYKQYGAQIVYENASLFIGPGDRIGLVGANGTGKTTLFRMITGEETPDSGKIRFDPHISSGMLSQESQCTLGITVREEMQNAFPEADETQNKIENLAAKLEFAGGHEQKEALRQLSQAQIDLEMQSTDTMEQRIGRVLHGLGFPTDSLDRLTDTFSGGWQMRIAMAKLLLREPDVLLLDEPTNHLDARAVKWLQGYISEYPGAVFVISHEPKFLDEVCYTIVELEGGKLVEYTGNYSQFRHQKEENEKATASAYERQQK